MLYLTAKREDKMKYLKDPVWVAYPVSPDEYPWVELYTSEELAYEALCRRHFIDEPVARQQLTWKEYWNLLLETSLYELGLGCDEEAELQSIVVEERYVMSDSARKERVTDS